MLSNSISSAGGALSISSCDLRAPAQVNKCNSPFLNSTSSVNSTANITRSVKESINIPHLCEAMRNQFSAHLEGTALAAHELSNKYSNIKPFLGLIKENLNEDGQEKFNKILTKFSKTSGDPVKEAKAIKDTALLDFVKEHATNALQLAYEESKEIMYGLHDQVDNRQDKTDKDVFIQSMFDAEPLLRHIATGVSNSKSLAELDTWLSNFFAQCAALRTTLKHDAVSGTGHDEPVRKNECPAANKKQETPKVLAYDKLAEEGKGAIVFNVGHQNVNNVNDLQSRKVDEVTKMLLEHNIKLTEHAMGLNDKFMSLLSKHPCLHSIESVVPSKTEMTAASDKDFKNKPHLSHGGDTSPYIISNNDNDEAQIDNISDAIETSGRADTHSHTASTNIHNQEQSVIFSSQELFASRHGLSNEDERIESVNSEPAAENVTSPDINRSDRTDIAADFFLHHDGTKTGTDNVSYTHEDSLNELDINGLNIVTDLASAVNKALGPDVSVVDNAEHSVDSDILSDGTALSHSQVKQNLSADSVSSDSENIELSTSTQNTLPDTTASYLSTLINSVNLRKTPKNPDFGNTALARNDVSVGNDSALVPGPDVSVVDNAELSVDSDIVSDGTALSRSQVKQNLSADSVSSDSENVELRTSKQNTLPDTTASYLSTLINSVNLRKTPKNPDFGNTALARNDVSVGNDSALVPGPDVSVVDNAELSVDSDIVSDGTTLSRSQVKQNLSANAVSSDSENVELRTSTQNALPDTATPYSPLIDSVNLRKASKNPGFVKTEDDVFFTKEIAKRMSEYENTHNRDARVPVSVMTSVIDSLSEKISSQRSILDNKINHKDSTLLKLDEVSNDNPVKSDSSESIRPITDTTHVGDAIQRNSLSSTVPYKRIYSSQRTRNEFDSLNPGKRDTLYQS